MFRANYYGWAFVQFDEPSKVSNVVHAFGRASSGQLLMLPQGGRLLEPGRSDSR
jgi:hypothetical protein